MTRLVHNFDSTIYYRADADGTRTQVYDSTHRRPTDYGDANRVDYFRDNFEQYTKDNGNKVLARPEGIQTDYGNAKAIETAPDGTDFYHRLDGTVVERYPAEVTSNFGNIQAVEAKPQGLILHRPPGSVDFQSLEIDFASKRMTYLDGNGDIIPNGFKALTDLILRKFNQTQYPNGKTMPQGQVRSIETDINGVNTYRLVDGSVVKDQ